jgi:hypothetical protein
MPSYEQLGFRLRVTVLVLFVFRASACNRPDPSATAPSATSPTTSPADGLPLYTCQRSSSAITIDGLLNDPAWRGAPWTPNFASILGPSGPRPAHRTRCKMLYDEQYLYIAAELEEPHLWATDHTTKLYNENAFEIFLDVNSNGRDYWEIEINPKNIAWILNMPKPYAEGGRPPDDVELAGVRSAVRLDGTLNDPSDTDRSWTIEFAIPWSALVRFSKVTLPPRPGDDWRINLARVGHRLETDAGEYRPLPDTAEYSTFSAPGEMNMHTPGSFGHLHFASP